MAKILVNAYDLTDTDTTSFIDVSADHWAASDINKLKVNNITTGYGDNSFRPNISISRLHFSVFLYRAIK